ncbi:Phosphoribosylamine--glycine ligase [Rickettsiales bacterium Ac37b]|nr:Phosphoribosylamine--glycine ligase [Rickettsiales bacterium Ac37b]
MKLLVIGSGGREHAICFALLKSSITTKIYAAPGNAGIAEIAQIAPIDYNNHRDIAGFCLEKQIDLVIVGPEAPLVDGLIDYLENYGIKAFGPSKNAAILEASKSFTKNLCKKYNIPTAEYGCFDNHNDAKTYLDSIKFPIVIKADGLAAGKGVIIAENKNEATSAIDDMFAGKFGEAGNHVVIEEFLEGKEISFFVICDGTDAIFLGAAEDYKRAFDNNKGLNTGGMGSFSPSRLLNDLLKTQIMDQIINPTMHAMKVEGRPFKGILFAGLMLTNEGPKLLEYNVRFGDPETESILLCLKTDLLELLLASNSGDLSSIKVEHYNHHAVCVIMAADGYPGEYQKDTIISGLSEVSKLPNIAVFHAGTKKDYKHNIVANGGRVLAITAIGNSLTEARERAYDAVHKITWSEGFYRTDIAL